MKENYGNKNKISRFRHRYDCNTPSNQMQTQISMPHQQRPAQILSELPEQYHQQLMQLFNHFQQQSKQRIMPTQDPYQQRPVQRSPDKSFHQHLSQLKDIYQQRLMQTLSGDPIHVMEPLTDEQLAFEIEFKKWEKNFADWQKAYASHHDRVAFKQYEEKFLEVREKLLKRRFQIYSKNSVQQKLASELGAAEAMAESILQKFSDSVTPNFHERVESDRFAKRFLQQPLAPSWNDDNLRMQRSRSQYCNRDLPGSSRHQQFATSSSRKENVRERNDRWIYDRRKINQRADDRNSRSKRENITNRPQVSAKTLKKRENQLKQELESKDVKSNIPWLAMDEQKPVLVAKKEKKKKRKTFKVLPMTSGLKEKFGQLFKKAKLLECPNRLSGSARRRFANLDKKNTAEWTQDEKFFMEFAEFTRNARKKYFNKLKANNTNEVPQPSIKDENVQKASA